MLLLRLLIAFLWVVAFGCVDAALTKEKILENREKRVRQIQQSLRVVQKQIDGHTSGTKTIDDGKLLSLKSRVEKYQSEIADFSRKLSDEEIDEIIQESQSEAGEL
ncbi:hypothetical protein IV203_026167 [Nitzschia inconspicua]|uniref:Uncharacterized protein n=1 Tax=Nitzschia inconspicua TaxID=303405 RepID=A0A9K3LIL6_9STRA|nr:hypothetical protein IV203_026167 [Nitzschia inconspicua]